MEEVWVGAGTPSCLGKYAYIGCPKILTTYYTITALNAMSESSLSLLNRLERRGAWVTRNSINIKHYLKRAGDDNTVSCC